MTSTERVERSPGTRVLLLGTAGGPGASPGLDGGRSGIAAYVEVDGTGYVVDCGTGSLLAMQRIGLDTADMRCVFVTHLHSDHIYDYGSVLYNKWARRVVPKWETYGPSGLAGRTQEVFEYFSLEADSRFSEGGYAAPWRQEHVTVHEFAPDGDVMRAHLEGAVVRADDRVRVSAVPVNHPPLPSVAYRFDTPDLSIVFGGDTAPNDTLWRLARGADILVHEAIYPDAIRRFIDNEKKLEHVLGAHSTPQQAGETAARAGVRTLVLSHLAPGDSTIVSDDMWREAAAETFEGEIVVGQDLLQIQ